MDKIFEFFRLEPVESFKPECKKSISGRGELILRLIIDVLVAGILVHMGRGYEIGKNCVIICIGIFLIELLWNGMKRFAYIQDIIIHISAIIIFIAGTLICENHLIVFFWMVVARCYTEFQYGNLYDMKTIDAQLLKDWESYSARCYKIAFIICNVFGYVMLKSLNII